MKHPKIFLLIIFFISLLLFFIDLPKSLSIKEIKIPLGKRVLHYKNISIGIPFVDLDLRVARIRREFVYKLGLDLQGGTRLVYKVDMSSISSAERSTALESARNVIERRINFFGVDEPTIQTLKVGSDHRVVIELPGISDVRQAIDLIGKTAQLSFWEGGGVSATHSASIPASLRAVVGEDVVKTELTGRQLQSAKVGFNQSDGKPQVQLTFTQEGTTQFADITKRNVGKQVAIVLDDQVLTAPVVNEPILNGSAVITGGFTTQEAKYLSIALNAGALPAPLELIAQSSTGPSLGLESLKKSLFAGALGLLSIVFFMGFLYRREGILACVALLIYSIIVLFVFKLIPVTLTLAGIAGFILSIGMAVDANILIFERMREERRAGKDRDISLALGFARAWSSIRDSNIASLITCIILFYFGSGMVRGFALTLAIGILVSMFSAITVTKSLLKVFGK